MAEQNYSQSSGYWGVPWALMLRIQDAEESDIQQADVYSIDVEVWDVDRPNTIIGTEAFTAAEAVFDTLQTGMGWDDEAKPDGFNTRLEFDGTLNPDPGKRYRYLIEATMQDGTTVRHTHDRTTFSRTQVGSA